MQYDSKDASYRYAKGCMAAMRSKLSVRQGVKYLWHIGRLEGDQPQTALVVACNYSTKFYLAAGQLQGDTFTLTKPIAITNFQEAIAQTLSGLAPKTLASL